MLTPHKDRDRVVITEQKTPKDFKKPIRKRRGPNRQRQNKRKARSPTRSASPTPCPSPALSTAESLPSDSDSEPEFYNALAYVMGRKREAAANDDRVAAQTLGQHSRGQQDHILTHMSEASNE
jgi:hypothetical protein